MSLINNSPFTYEGDTASAWIMEMFMQSVTYQNAMVMEGVKGKTKLPNISGDDLLQAGSCNFDDNNNLDFTEKEIEVVDLMVNRSWCYSDLTSINLNRFLKKGSNNDSGLGTPIEEKILAFVKGKVPENIEKILWQGDTAGSTGTYLDTMDGFLAKFAANSVATHAGTTLNAGNFITQMRAFIAAFPANIQQHMYDDDFYILIPTHVLGLHYTTIGAANTALGHGTDFAGMQKMFDAVKLMEVPGLPVNNLVAAKWSNLFIGTDLTADQNEVQLLDLKKSTGDKKVRLSIDLKLGVTDGMSTEIFWYKP